jgi:hypothetical protein
MRGKYSNSAPAHSHPEGGVCFSIVTGIGGIDHSAFDRYTAQTDQILAPAIQTDEALIRKVEHDIVTYEGDTRAVGCALLCYAAKRLRVDVQPAGLGCPDCPRKK